MCMTKILSGKNVADEIFASLKLDVERLKSSGMQPSLAIIRANEDEGSGYYERSLLKKCEEVGIVCEAVHVCEESWTTKDLIDTVSNYTQKSYSILVLEPLPRSVDKRSVFNSIPCVYDADCLSEVSLGNLLSGHSGIAPCTPKSVIKILDFYDYNLEGKDVCIVGRSNIVGKPLSLLMTERNATVTLCHSKTNDLAKHTIAADIVVFATGSPERFGCDFVTESSVVVDVGTTLNDEGKYVGDVVFDEMDGYVSALTPVKGGVGACTTACLLQNVVNCCMLNSTCN